MQIRTWSSLNRLCRRVATSPTKTRMSFQKASIRHIFSYSTSVNKEPLSDMKEIDFNVNSVQTYCQLGLDRWILLFVPSRFGHVFGFCQALAELNAYGSEFAAQVKCSRGPSTFSVLPYYLFLYLLTHLYLVWQGRWGGINTMLQCIMFCFNIATTCHNVPQLTQFCVVYLVLWWTIPWGWYCSDLFNLTDRTDTARGEVPNMGPVHRRSWGVWTGESELSERGKTIQMPKKHLRIICDIFESATLSLGDLKESDLNQYSQ
jgi:hypothetical protein